MPCGRVIRGKRLNDGHGLCLLLFVKGGAHAWRFDFSYHGRRKTISLGTYSDTLLALARRKADEARQFVAEDIDPSQKRKAEKESWAQERIADEREAQGLPPIDSFEAVARVSERHIPATPESAYIGQGAVGIIRPRRSRHIPAITEPKRLGELLRAIDSYAATPVVRAALKLAPMVLLRPGELRFAEWPEIDLDAARWTVPAIRMKRELRQKLHGAPHLVPLPRQAVEVLRELHPLTGHAKIVFRGERHHDRAMSENTINAALRVMGFSADEVTGHGFRSPGRCCKSTWASTRTSSRRRCRVDVAGPWRRRACFHRPRPWRARAPRDQS